MKHKWKRKKESKKREEENLKQIKQRYRIGKPGPMRGDTPDPLVSKPFVRQGNNIPTSDRIVGFVGKKDILHEHKWKRGAREDTETVAEIERKSTRIAPAYNKGPVQYITDDADAKTLGKKV